MTQSSSVLKKPSIEAAVGVLAGIDIGMHAAKLVVAHRHNHGLNVTRASCLPISPEIQGDGRMLARLLCDWLRENSEPGCRDFAATLPSSMVDYEAIQVPSPDLMDIDEFAHQAINDLLGNESSLATYLTVVARRIVVREMLRRRTTEASLGQMDSAYADQSVGHEQRISDREQVQQLLDGLQGPEAEVVRMYHLEGKSYQEISSAVGMPENSIGPTLSRARAKMRRASAS